MVSSLWSNEDYWPYCHRKKHHSRQGSFTVNINIDLRHQYLTPSQDYDSLDSSKSASRSLEQLHLRLLWAMLGASRAASPSSLFLTPMALILSCCSQQKLF